MVSVCFYFQVHQPYRVRKYPVFDIGKKTDYFSDNSESNLNNEKILKKVATKCYLNANKVILDLIKKHPQFKVAYSFSGVILDQFIEFYPEVLDSFRELVKTGNVEILSETYYHSLSFLFDKEEFKEQVREHNKKIKKLFDYTPKVFRNTELIYNNDLAKTVEEMGYEGVIAEGADHILGWKSPNFVYQPLNSKIKLLLKNYKLSDDIAFRFSERSWESWPLTTEKFSEWVNGHNGSGDVINLFMDYETLGEHQWEETGIFDFLRALPQKILEHPDNNFKTPSEVIRDYPSRGELDFPYFVSWADVERDLSAWHSNQMQQSSMNSLYALKEDVLKTKDPEIIKTWRKLQTSDHFYYMCTKWFEDGDVHKYFNPYESPYEAFINFMNVLNDLKLRVSKKEINENSVFPEEFKKYPEIEGID
ncbi:glycoside hydrolase family 57 protein [Patescibacteria group bacterium]|nr:glycoside hydrolase family 57 protein [Patescibacteria group bacterium]